MRGQRGQQIGEYAILLGAVAIAFLASQMHMTRSVGGGLAGLSNAVLGPPVVEDAEGGSDTTATSSELATATAVDTRTTTVSSGSHTSGFSLVEGAIPDYLVNVDLSGMEGIYGASTAANPVKLADLLYADVYGPPTPEESEMVIEDSDGDGYLEVYGGFEPVQQADLNGDGFPEIFNRPTETEEAESRFEAMAEEGSIAAFKVDLDKDDTVEPLEVVYVPLVSLTESELKASSKHQNRQADRERDEAQAVLLERFGSDAAVTVALDMAKKQQEGKDDGIVSPQAEQLHQRTQPELAETPVTGNEDQSQRDFLDREGITNLTVAEFDALVSEMTTVDDPDTAAVEGSKLSEAYQIVSWSDQKTAKTLKGEKQDASGRTVIWQGEDGQWHLGDDYDTGALVTQVNSEDAYIPTPEATQTPTGTPTPSATGTPESTQTPGVVTTQTPQPGEEDHKVGQGTPLGIDNNHDGDLNDTGDVLFHTFAVTDPAQEEVHIAAISTVGVEGAAPQLLVDRVTTQGRRDPETGIWDADYVETSTEAEIHLPLAKHGSNRPVAWAVVTKDSSDSSSGLVPTALILDSNGNGREDRTDRGNDFNNPILIVTPLKPGDTPSAGGEDIPDLLEQIQNPQYPATEFDAELVGYSPAWLQQMADKYNSPVTRPGPGGPVGTSAITAMVESGFDNGARPGVLGGMLGSAPRSPIRTSPYSSVGLTPSEVKR